MNVCRCCRLKSRSMCTFPRVLICIPSVCVCAGVDLKVCLCVWDGLIVRLARPVTGSSVTRLGNWNDRLIQSPSNSITHNLTIKHTQTHTHLLSLFILGLSLHHCQCLLSLSRCSSLSSASPTLSYFSVFHVPSSFSVPLTSAFFPFHPVCLKTPKWHFVESL